jgi:hypothetical protein
MRFKIQTELNDGMRDAPPITAEAESIDDLLFLLKADDALTNDYGVPIPVGAIVTIERVA